VAAVELAVGERNHAGEPASRTHWGEKAGKLVDGAGQRVESSPRLLLGISLFLFLVVTLSHAKRRLWFDELHTLYLSGLPTYHDMWRALLAGVDFNPPAVYLFTRWSNQWIGTSPTATRLPEILLAVVMCLSLFTFVRRRRGVFFGLGAMWFPLITVAANYSSEARPHSLVLGFCALAMAGWQRAADGGRRGWALAVMSFSIAGFLMSHCYSVLILLAFGAAELTRLAIRKKPDWVMWLCIVAPMSTGLVYLPMLHGVGGLVMQSVIFKPGLANVPRFYGFLLNDQGGGSLIWQEAIWPVAMVVIIAGILRQAPAADGRSGKTGWPAYELVFLSALALLPLFGQSLAVLARSPFTDRYALAAVIGLGALLAEFVFRSSGGNRRAGLAMTLIFGGWFVTSFVTWFGSLVQTHPWDLPTIQLATLPKDTLIVISDPLMFLEAEYYEPPQVAERLRLLTDPLRSVEYTGSDMFDKGLYRTKTIFPFPGKLVDYKTFVSSTPHFMAYGPFANPEDWVFRTLLASGAEVNIQGQSNYPSTHGTNCMLVDVRTTARN